MPKLKKLSGKELLSIFSKFGFEVYSRKGSHIKIRRVGEKGEKQTLAIPNHKVLDTGTCFAVYRQAKEYIPESELYPHFYTG